MAERGVDQSDFRKPSSAELSRLKRAELAQFVAASVGRASNLYPHWLLLKIEGPLGISSSRFIVLWLLGSGRRMSMGTIAKAIDLTPRGVSRIVDGLEAAGLAKRVTGESDRRLKYVELTRKGRRFVNDSMPIAQDAFGGLFAVLEKAEAVELIRLLEILTDRMKSQIDSHPSSPDPSLHS